MDTRTRFEAGPFGLAPEARARLSRHVEAAIRMARGRRRRAIAAVTVPIFNEHTLPAFTGVSDPERALRGVRATHNGMLCVTLGSRGSMLLDGDTLIHEDGFGVEPVDTTAAGDVFRAAFIYGLLRGSRPHDLLRFANAAAAISCTRAGAMASVPSRQEVEDALSGAV